MCSGERTLGAVNAAAGALEAEDFTKSEYHYGFLKLRAYGIQNEFANAAAFLPSKSRRGSEEFGRLDRSQLAFDNEGSFSCF